MIDSKKKEAKSPSKKNPTQGQKQLVKVEWSSLIEDSKVHKVGFEVLENVFSYIVQDISIIFESLKH